MTGSWQDRSMGVTSVSPAAAQQNTALHTNITILTTQNYRSEWESKRKRAIEREREREIVSYLTEACFAQGYVSLFLASRLSPPSITQQQEAKKKKKEVWLSAHHTETLSSSLKRTAAVQAWKCSRLKRHKSTHERTVCNKEGGGWYCYPRAQLISRVL